MFLRAPCRAAVRELRGRIERIRIQRRSGLLALSLLAYGVGVRSTLGAPLPEPGRLHTMQIEGVTVQYAVPKPLPARLSADGNTVYGGSSPVVLIANPAVPTTRLRIPPASLASQAIGDAPGVRAPTTSFSISYYADGETDPWGAPCVTFPAAAKTAFNAAAAIWASRLNTTVPITIHAGWAPLGGSVLGYSGGGPHHRNFSGAPRADTWYMGSLANACAGTDLDPAMSDMYITYNSSFSWYFGTDGNTPTEQVDLVTVVLHEIGHGLNFAGAMGYNSDTDTGGWGSSGDPNIYDTFTRDGAGVSLLDPGVYPNPSVALGNTLRSDSVWFHGPKAMAANGGIRVRLYAPATWAGGSSYSHLDDVFAGTANALMKPSLSRGDSLHDPGPVIMGLLFDLGWTASWTPPTGVTATDGTHVDTVQITWNNVIDATHYRVSRATSVGGTKTDLGSWQTGTTYTDAPPAEGTPYYYWVRAAKSNAGASATGYSASDTGFRALWLSPTNVVASVGTYADRVQVTWDSALGATHYRVSRATSAGGTKTELGSWQAGTEYSDTTATPLTVYFYWVRAAKSSAGAGATSYGSSTTGWRKLPAPTGFSASRGTVTGRVRLSWSSVSGASHYRVTRIATNGATTELGSWQTGTSYDDDSAVSGATYSYWVRAGSSSAGANASAYSSQETGWWTLDTPTDVNASDGTYTDRVEVVWSSVAGATHYRVSRSDSAVSTKTDQGVWQTGTNYSDTTASPGYTYYYWVRAATSSAGANATPHSACNTGWRRLTVPDGVAASDGTYADTVMVLWNTVAGAEYYRVSRSDSIGGPKTDLTPWQPSRRYYDTTAAAGTTYYYWVRAARDSNGTNASDYNAPETGWRKLAPPAGISASQGAFSARVELTWNSGSDATHYRISRSESLEGVKTDLSGWQTATSFNDLTAQWGTYYHYWVRAATGGAGENASDYGSSAQGWLGLPVPTSVSASDGAHAEHVLVTWAGVPTASHYRVSRSTSVGGVKTELSAWQASTSYVDTTAAPGVTYYYWVRASQYSSGSSPSDYSTSDTGARAVSAPTGISATDGTDTRWVQVTWDGAPGATHYRISRSDTVESSKTNLTGWQTGTSYNDATAMPGNDRCYWVQSATSSAGANASAYGGYDIGWRMLSAPGNATASDGLYPDFVLVSWQMSPGAMRHRLSRSESLEGARTVLVDWQATLSFYDYTALPGKVYYYWPQAAMDDGGARASTSFNDTGWRGLIELPSALDAPQQVWTTGGDAAWFGQSAVSHDGAASAQSGAITHNQTSWMETTVVGPGRLSFWWKVSSDPYDRLRFRVDGVQQDSISGEQDWVPTTNLLAAGTHTLHWSYYKDKANNGGSDCGWVDQVVWTPAPSAPATVAASDGAHTDRIMVSWAATQGATHYLLSRSESALGAKTVLGTWTADTTYTDDSALPGVYYYYSVQAALDGGGTLASGHSAPNKGYRALEAPFSVSASDGDYAGSVRLEWTAVSGATHYQAYRAATLGGYKTYVGSLVTATTCDDATAVPGVTYYYWVRAVAQSGEGTNMSGFGAYDTGFCGLALPTALDTPGWTWTSGGAAPWFGQAEVAGDGVDAAQSGAVTHNQTSWMETTLDGPGELSFWWKVSSEADADSLEFFVDGAREDRISGKQDWQRKLCFLPAGSRTLRWSYLKDAANSANSDCGWVDEVTFVPALPAPTGVGASDGAQADRVHVTWEAVPGATCYLVSRSASAESAKTNLGTWQTETAYSDTSATPGTPYHYWVRAAAGGGGELASGYGGPDTGWRAQAPRPDFVVLSISLKPTTVAVGDTVTATVTVKNQGAAGGPAGWLDAYTHAPEPVAGGAEGNWWHASGELAVGQTNVFQHSFTAPVVGMRVYRAFVDSSGQTEEDHESNNQSTASYSVVPPYGGGFFRIRSADPATLLELRPDGLLVWKNTALGGTGQVSAATTLTGSGDWVDIHEFTADAPLMSRPVFVP